MAVSSSRFTGIALAVALGAFALSAHAQVYKCKDSAGKTIYSGKPCEYGGKPLDISDNVIQGERPPENVYGPSPNSTAPLAVDPMSPKCAELSDEMHKLSMKNTSPGIVDAYNDRSRFNKLKKEYELTCLGVASTDEPKPKKSTKKNMDPLAYPSSTMCPDGSFVPGKTGCRQLPNGTFVQGGRGTAQCPDGSVVGGSRCVLQPNGKFIGAD